MVLALVLLFVPCRPSGAQEHPSTATPGAASVEGKKLTRPPTFEPERTKAAGEEPGEEQEEEKKAGFVGIPIPIANPTVQQGLALVGVVMYQLGEDAPPSFTGAGVAYTSSDSWGAGVVQKIYTDGDRWRITAGGLGYHLNLKFYGIGADPEEGARYLPITQKGWGAGVRVLRNLGGKFYLGLDYLYVSNTTAFKLGGLDPDIPIPDIQGRRTISLAALPFLWDTRKNQFNPKQGNVLAFQAIFSDDALGSDFTYQQYRLAYNHYAPLGERHVLAFRTTACGTQGRAPFYLICALGTVDALRGFPAGMYRDRASASALLEWRWNFAGRWGTVVFTGAGVTAPTIGNLSIDDPIPSYGVGIRFLMSRDYGVNIGIDYGRSKASDAIYFRIGESF